MSEEKELRAAVVEALRATDSGTSWYLDRRKARVVSVAGGQASDPLLHAADVEDDEIRFVEIPAVTEAEVHGWMEDFVEEAGAEDSAAAAASLDHKPGANARFEERLSRRAPATLSAWHRFLQARILAKAETWCAAALSEPIPGDGRGLVADD
jgi:uncharacterized protein UPF0158